MRQNKITILSTKAIDDALINDAASRNVFIDVVSFIRTRPLSSIASQQEIKQALMLSTTVVFTSANAVEAVAAKLGGQKPNWKIFCTGYATARSAERDFGKNLIVGTADNAPDLAELIVNRTGTDNLIFFCGNQRRNELPDLLRENNVAVNEIVVYKTIATPSRTRKKYDGILFFSPSAVASFFQNNQVHDKTILFAIGSTTANEIQKYAPAGDTGKRYKIIVSNTPEKKTLLEKVITYFQADSIHH